MDWWALGVILFEFLNGNAPFTADTKEEIFRKIAEEDPAEWTEDASTDAKDLIARLLEKDPGKRLGASGAEEIKAHAFFEGIEWEKLRLTKASFVPRLRNFRDTKYFAKDKKNFSLSVLKAGEHEEEEKHPGRSVAGMFACRYIL